MISLVGVRAGRSTTRTAGRTRDLMDGVVAGLAGSSALNAVGYVDIVVRGRPASSTPQETAGRLAEVAHVNLGPEARAANRRSGLGQALGYVAGVVPSALFTALARRSRIPLPVAAVLLAAGAMLAGEGPMVALKVTDPRRWSGADWLSDVIPHLAYGFVAAATWRMLDGARRARR